ncbi:MAG: cell division protein SepF [Armatimonadota bacterium]|nr:cell division protein SepF [Armatimonadota bacterium]MDR5697160.1 cell division protein SepF [Armatimonadota bacterium]
MGAIQRLMGLLGFDEEEEPYEELSQDDEPRRRAPILRLHSPRQQDIVVVQPRTFDDARSAAEYLKGRRPIVVNLREADRDVAQRIVDFLCGVDYAVDGHLQRIAEEIFLFTPSNIVITSESARPARRDETVFPIS